jgi:hypothetical protein
MLRRFGVAAVLVALAARAAGGQGDDAAAKEVIDKAIKAGGGAAALEKYKASTSKFKGTFYGMGAGIPITGSSASQLPDRARNEMEIEANGQTFTAVQVISGDKGWMSLNGRTMDMPKELLEEARAGLHAAAVTHLTPLRDKAYKLSPLGEAKVGDKSAVGVRVSREGYRDINLFFDKDTGLLLRSEMRVKDVQGGGDEMTQETLYEGYKKVGDLQLPHKLTIKRDGKPFVESELSEIKPAEKLDDSTFAKP